MAEAKTPNVEKVPEVEEAATITEVLEAEVTQEAAVAVPKKEKVLRVKIIAKNPKLSRTAPDGSHYISIKHNHIKYKIDEGSVTELPEGVVKMLKEHITREVVPTGEKRMVKGSRYAVKVYNSFELMEL